MSALINKIPQIEKCTFTLRMEEHVMADRKKDHIDLAFRADMQSICTDSRFYYEPALAGHQPDLDLSLSFLGKQLHAPLWVSSMTGGTTLALTINQRLATACRTFGLGMGLGSCRPLLENHDRLADFDVRDWIGPDLPLYANLGIAQLETLLDDNRSEEITSLIQLLRADGLIIHINPLQEWLQPEGDQIKHPPVETISRLLGNFKYPVIVKEVGQGFGPESIRTLLKMPLAAIELAAYGGTNFAKLELLRSEEDKQQLFHSVARLGHTVDEMIEWINHCPDETVQCKQIILSGGVRDFLDGFYYMNRIKLPSLYGQASRFLKYATISQEALDAYIVSQIQGLRLARTFLRVR